MSDHFHILLPPKLKRAAEDCPLLEGNSEAWIVCCSRRFFPLAKRIARDDDLAYDVLQTSWLKILQSINHASFNRMIKRRIDARARSLSQEGRRQS